MMSFTCYVHYYRKELIFDVHYYKGSSPLKVYFGTGSSTSYAHYNGVFCTLHTYNQFIMFFSLTFDSNLSEGLTRSKLKYIMNSILQLQSSDSPLEVVHILSNLTFNSGLGVCLPWATSKLATHLRHVFLPDSKEVRK